MKPLLVAVDVLHLPHLVTQEQRGRGGGRSGGVVGLYRSGRGKGRRRRRKRPYGSGNRFMNPVEDGQATCREMNVLETWQRQIVGGGISRSPSKGPEGFALS